MEMGGLPATPALDLTLARGSGGRTGDSDPLAALAGAFGVAATTGSDLPSAPLCLLAELPDLAGEGCWFHADPVHLRADRDRLLLFGGPDLGVRPEESESLVSAFNAHFSEDGLGLVATRPGRWYLHIESAPDVRTQPLHRVAGRPLDAYLPSGPDARAWIRWQNEAQMLFFSHPVHAARERAGEPILSGIWTWGGGVLPKVSKGPDLTVSDHPFALGLAHAAGRLAWEPRGLAGDWASGFDPGTATVLVFWDRLWWPSIQVDADAWRLGLSGLETLVAAAVAALRSRRCRSVCLEDGEGRRFVLDRSGLRRFWRSRGGLADRLRTRGRRAMGS
jgi:hypothetical protein